jgi:hypothetical protein
MPRPYKIKEPYTTLNIVIPIAMKEQLSKDAHSLSKKYGKEVSMGDIIRECIKKGQNH